MAPVLPTEFELAPRVDLVAYARNARTHSDAQIQQIARSMEEFGWTNPVLVRRVEAGLQIIAGHGRVLAAELLDLPNVPVLYLDHLSDDQVRAYVLADNRLALEAGWDEELLRLELGSLTDAGFDLSLTGFSKSELDGLLIDGADEAGLVEDDEVPPVPADPVSRPGDLWILGDHRVLCGDSTDIDAVARLAGGREVDCVWTDPPYNVAYNSKLAGSIANDDMGDAQFRAFLRDALVAAWSVMAPGAPIYVAHADTEGFNFRGAFLEAGFKLSGCLVWVKPSLVLGRSDYQWRHEPILYGWKPGAAHPWFGARNKTTVLEAGDLPVVVEPDGAGVQIEIGETTLRISGSDLRLEELRGSIIRHEKPRRSADHPTMKPVELVLGMLRNSSPRGAVVLDLFGGSGSTLIACQKSGRASRLMEFDPKFVDVIVRRWEMFSGRSAVLEETGEAFGALEGARGAA